MKTLILTIGLGLSTYFALKGFGIISILPGLIVTIGLMKGQETKEYSYSETNSKENHTKKDQ